MAYLDTHTPALGVIDPRALSIRCIAYYRHESNAPAQPRSTRTVRDLAGRVVAQRDARLEHATLPNVSTVFSLGGQALLTDGVDAGWRLRLFAAHGALTCAWDGRRSMQCNEYDRCLRLVAVHEAAHGKGERTAERLAYGEASDENAKRNRCGRLLRHDDDAGNVMLEDYGLSGAPLVHTRRFLSALELPDWTDASGPRDARLRRDHYTTRSVLDAAGGVLERTDASGHLQMFRYDIAGQIHAVHLQMTPDAAPLSLARGMRYNAPGLVERQEAGNGCVTTWQYRAEDGRLLRQCSALPGKAPLQHLRFGYDPAGNVLFIENSALSVSHYRNHRIEPIQRFVYDSLYQLVEASGYQVEGNPDRPGLPALQGLPLDPNRLAAYLQRYDYDLAGNLLARHHTGNATWRMSVAQHSNRSLPCGQDVAGGFDANGNQSQLQRGQPMEWDVRNQLLQVTRITREGADDDRECYRYDAAGLRVRKVAVSRGGGRMLQHEVLYVPGLEVRMDTATRERYEVVTVPAGAQNVSVLHWREGKPGGMGEEQLRYQITDHLGSGTLELSAQGEILSHEGYYPFGGTAWWAARSALGAEYKTARYAGKERDATGLYYYGHRYYAPWTQRWISADPAGLADGLNLYGFVRNSPIGSRDRAGAMGEEMTRGKAFEVPDLLERLDALGPRVVRAVRIVEFEYLHDSGNDAILSEYTRAGAPRYEGDVFENVFTPSTWRFDKNFREPDAGHPEVFASDVVLYQYLKKAEENRFSNVLPSLLIRHTVVNEGVRDAVNEHPSGTEAFRRRFLETTQNGRSTQRILDQFGLTATRVQYTHKPVTGELDILVHVEPQPGIAHTVIEPGPVDTRSRFTVNRTAEPAKRPPGPPVASRFTVAPVVPRPSRFSVSRVAERRASGIGV